MRKVPGSLSVSYTEDMLAIVRIDSHVLHVSAKTNWWFVSVADSSGAVGWGEGSLNGWEPLLDAMLDRLRPEWIGLALDVVPTTVHAAPGSPGGLVHSAVVSALLQAVLSLQAQQARQTPQALLGPARRSQVAVYANINRATLERSPEGFVATARRAQALGFSGFKAAPFDGLTPALCGSAEGRSRIQHGVSCMLALRDALGPEARLMVDCHWRFDEARALQTLRDLEPARLHWFECPIAETHAHWPALRRLRQAAREQGVKLSAAETQVGLDSFKVLFDEGLYDVVMPDVKYCGGPWEMLRIAERAADCGVDFSPHNPTGPVCTWHSLLVASVAPECAMLELQFDESDLYDAVQLGADIRPQRGQMVCSAGPGQVQQLDLTVLQDHPYRPVPPGIETLLNR